MNCFDGIQRQFFFWICKLVERDTCISEHAQPLFVRLFDFYQTEYEVAKGYFVIES